MKILQEPVLMLNKSWLAVDTCTVANAFSRLFAGTAKFLDTTNYSMHGVDGWLLMPVPDGEPAIRTARLSIRVPDVIVLRSSVTPKRRTMQFSRRNLMKRDGFRCQYCGVQPGSKDMTVDHVLPRRRGGRSSWTNCVASCLECNARKADRTPQEAGMPLVPRPEAQAACPHDPSKWSEAYEPAWSPVFRVSSTKASWRHFLSSEHR